MKKRYIKYLIFSFFVIGTLILIIFLNARHSKITQILNYPKNYSLCNMEHFDVIIYSDNDELSFLEVKNLTNCEIIDEENNCYQIKIKEIIKQQKVLIKEHVYYQYVLKFKMPLEVEVVEHLDNVTLKMVNKRGEELVFNIGNISIVNGDFFSIVDLKSIIGITKNINNYSTLDRIKMELYNFQLTDVTLKKVALISNIVTTDIKEVTINSGNTWELDVPLIYKQDTFINEVGLLLTWEYQGTEFEQLINTYTLFNTNSEPIKPVIQVLEIH